MPKKVHDLAMKLEKKGYAESKAWAIANSVMKKKLKVGEKHKGKDQRGS